MLFRSAFSTLSEEVPSHELMSRLSAYFRLVSDVINDEAGTIDKFIGDGVMAFWGAPAQLDDHAFRSCVAAMRIQRGMRELNARWAQEGRPPLNVRIGPHRILFSTPDDFETMHPGIDLDPDFPVPGIAALELAVTSCDRAADHFAQWQVAFDELPDGRLAVPAREANGTILFFAEA